MSDSSLALTFLKEKFSLKAVARSHRFDLYEEETYSTIYHLEKDWLKN